MLPLDYPGLVSSCPYGTAACRAPRGRDGDGMQARGMARRGSRPKFSNPDAVEVLQAAQKQRAVRSGRRTPKPILKPRLAQDLEVRPSLDHYRMSHLVQDDDPIPNCYRRGHNGAESWEPLFEMLIARGRIQAFQDIVI